MITMKLFARGGLAVAIALTAAANVSAQTPTVDLSVNVFPTNLLDPNGGGTWTVVAKTNSTIGIAGIDVFFYDVNDMGITVESDLGHWAIAGSPAVETIDGAVRVTYFQNNADGPLVGGVGTLSMSDGADPLGDAAWDDATLIFSGAYNATVPSIAVDIGPDDWNTDANTFGTLTVGQPAIDAVTAVVVRVDAIPEPSTAAIAACGLASVIALRRRARR